MEETKTFTNNTVKVRNVRYCYFSPETGKYEEKVFGDGTYEEIQAQIEEFEKSLKGDK